MFLHFFVVAVFEIREPEMELVKIYLLFFSPLYTFHRISMKEQEQARAREEFYDILPALTVNE